MSFHIMTQLSTIQQSMVKLNYIFSSVVCRYVSVDDYEEDEFPPYCLGGGYLMSKDILLHILKPMYTQRVIHLEDIFIGVLINKFNIQPNDYRKGFNLLFSGNNKLCDYLHILLLHPVKTSELLSMHLQANLARKVC